MEGGGGAAFFNEYDKDIIREYPEIIPILLQYIAHNGAKPTISTSSTPPRTIKVVGRDSFDEENDFRLYQNKCDAYNYLTNSALNKNTEVGAYITDRGIIIGPNSKGGPKSYVFDRGVNVYSVNGNKVYDYSDFFLASSNMGLLNVKGFIHTHPALYSIEPSGDDNTFASFGHADHFIIGTRDGMIQAARFDGGSIISLQLINNFKQTQGCN